MNATIRGLLCVGLLVQLLVRCRHRVGHSPGIGWEGVLERLKVLADSCADRAVIEALPKTDLSGMFQRMLNRWPNKEDFNAEPPAAVLALLTLVEAILGETRDEVVPNVALSGDVASIAMAPPEPWPWGVQWGADRTLCCPPAANPERQLEPETARAAARNRRPLDGADAQALEGALSLTERERSEALNRMNAAVGHAALNLRALEDATLAFAATEAGLKAQLDEARAALAKAIEDGKHWCEQFHAVLQERDEARSGRMAAEADHAELLRLYGERGAELERLKAEIAELEPEPEPEDDDDAPRVRCCGYDCQASTLESTAIADGWEQGPTPGLWVCPYGKVELQRGTLKLCVGAVRMAQDAAAAEKPEEATHGS